MGNPQTSLRSTFGNRAPEKPLPSICQRPAVSGKRAAGINIVGTDHSRDKLDGRAEEVRPLPAETTDVADGLYSMEPLLPLLDKSGLRRVATAPTRSVD